MIKIEDNKIEMALYIIDLKIANMIKNNQEKDYKKFQEKIERLKEEKKKIYNNDKEIIDKVLNIYLEEIKIIKGENSGK